MAKLYVVGIGPGNREDMTLRAVETIKKVDVVVGYKPYLAYIEDLIGDKERFSTGMRGEIERCKKAIEYVRAGKDTAIISSGDSGLYGMAGPILELAEDIEVEIIPGVTAAFSAAGELGAPVMHDYASISLSDHLTPYELIKKRVRMAGEGDFIVQLYNPRSKARPDYLKEIIEILLEYKAGSTPVGIVRNSGRPDRTITITRLDEIDYESIDMVTVIIIGNKSSFVKNGRMITPRGYDI